MTWTDVTQIGVILGIGGVLYRIISFFNSLDNKIDGMIVSMTQLMKTFDSYLVSRTEHHERKKLRKPGA